MVLKAVNWVYINKNRSYKIEKSDNMVLRTVNWVHNDKIRSDGLERNN